MLCEAGMSTCMHELSILMSKSMLKFLADSISFLIVSFSLPFIVANLHNEAHELWLTDDFFYE